RKQTSFTITVFGCFQIFTLVRRPLVIAFHLSFRRAGCWRTGRWAEVGLKNSWPGVCLSDPICAQPGYFMRRAKWNRDLCGSLAFASQSQSSRTELKFPIAKQTQIEKTLSENIQSWRENDGCCFSPEYIQRRAFPSY